MSNAELAEAAENALQTAMHAEQEGLDDLRALSRERLAAMDEAIDGDVVRDLVFGGDA